ncbi:MAG: hypothetical protein Q8S10_10950 [Thiobacillus sp.]|nr:hypothetical protein [Thiobacillus sp.]
MNTSPQPETRASSRTPDGAQTTEESVAAHAKRALMTRVRVRVAAVLDAKIARLQRLRTKVCGAPAEMQDDDRAGARRDRTRDREEPAAAAAEAPPKPKRRLRAALGYLSLVLMGSLAGGALAYTQFQKQLGALLQESQRLDAALAEKSRPSDEIVKAFEAEQARRAETEKKLAAAFIEYTTSTAESYALLESLVGQQVAAGRRLESSLTDTAQSHAETQKALDEAQAARIEAEEKLAATLVEHVGPASTQRQVDVAEEKQVAARQVDAAAPSAPRDASASRRSDASAAKPRNCTLDTRNVDALKDCISTYNK